jgi:DNA-binding NarL/FixJ family response regulator
MSLDQALIVANRKGRIMFATHQARNLLSAFYARRPRNVLPKEIAGWLRAPRRRHDPLRVIHPGRGVLAIEACAIPKAGNISLLRMQYRNGHNDPHAALASALRLTRREAEVLYWITEGKTNPEIAIILDKSLNTVKKHAINLFQKLGVENRTAAACMALDALQSTGSPRLWSE